MGVKFRDRFDELHAAASKAIGHDDFGDCDYHAGLRMLLASVDAGSLNAGKAALAEHTIVGILSSRLITQTSWNTHPEWRGRQVDRPLIVIGVPRTGTTALHQLLSLDPQFQGIERWLMWGPLARPPRETWQDHPQYLATVAAIEQAHAAAPEVMAAHGTGADDMDECLTPMAQSFVSNFFPSMLEVEDYDAWFQQQDEMPSYRRFANMLRLIGREDDRRWLLKNPSHLFGIEALLKIFPDACVVQTHRHPAQAVASLTNLLAGFREMAGGTPVDRDAMQTREIDFWAAATRRGMAAQDRQPKRFVNVLQHETRANPLGVVERIYQHFGLDLSDEAERKMRIWAADNPPGGQSGHAYRPVDSQDYLVESFAPYIEHYDL